MPAKPRRLTVKYEKLGRSRTWGLCHEELPLRIDERAKGKKHLEILLHEALHFLYPNRSEKEITKESIILCNTLWHEGYRRTDNCNDEPLQDGKK